MMSAHALPSFDRVMLTLPLGLARLTPALMFLPMLGEKTLGRGMLRAAFLTLLTLGLLPVFFGPDIDVHGLSLPATLVKEALIGLVLGLALGAPYYAATTMGDLLDNQRGATIAQSIDPTSEIETSLLGSFMGYLWAVLFFSGGGIPWILTTLSQSYRHIPLDGALTLDMATVLALGRMLGHAVQAGIVAATPAVAVLLLVDIGLGILSRFASQLNPFSLALTVKSVTAVMVLLLYVSSGTFNAMNELHGAWPLARLLPTP